MSIDFVLEFPCLFICLILRTGWLVSVFPRRRRITRNHEYSSAPNLLSIIIFPRFNPNRNTFFTRIFIGLNLNIIFNQQRQSTLTNKLGRRSVGLFVDG